MSRPERFVFLDDRPRPFMVNRQSNGEWWLYYWNEGSKNFVTLKQLHENELSEMRERALPDDDAKLYFDLATNIVFRASLLKETQMATDVTPAGQPFKKGEKIVCVDNRSNREDESTAPFTIGKTYTVMEDQKEYGEPVWVVNDDETEHLAAASRFARAPASSASAEPDKGGKGLVCVRCGAGSQSQLKSELCLPCVAITEKDGDYEFYRMAINIVGAQSGCAPHNKSGMMRVLKANFIAKPRHASELAALRTRAEQAELELALLQLGRAGDLDTLQKMIEQRNTIRNLLSASETARQKAEQERDEWKSQWSVMARACGNWREWPKDMNTCSPTREYLESDWHAGARAIIERDALQAQVTELQEKLAEAKFSPLGDNHHNANDCPYCTEKRNARIDTLETQLAEATECRDAKLAEVRRKLRFINKVQSERDELRGNLDDAIRELDEAREQLAAERKVEELKVWAQSQENKYNGVDGTENKACFWLMGKLLAKLDDLFAAQPTPAPTVKELQEILDNKEPLEVVTLPNGEIRAVPAPSAKSEDGVALIAAERKRQVESEGWTPEHDEEHGCEEMAVAAACYLTQSHSLYVPRDWPWDDRWWQPTPKDRVRELVKAGALIAAEIDRLQRAKPINSAAKSEPPTDSSAGKGERT